MAIVKSPAPSLLFACLAILAASPMTAHAADVALARLDCGGAPNPVSVAAFRTRTHTPT